MIILPKISKYAYNLDKVHFIMISCRYDFEVSVRLSEAFNLTHEDAMTMANSFTLAGSFSPVIPRG